MGEQTGARRTEIDAEDYQTIEALQHALDRKYRQLLDAAAADWQRLFAGDDPSADCVSVHIAREKNNPPQPSPRAGFLPKRARRANGEVRRRLA